MRRTGRLRPTAAAAVAAVVIAAAAAAGDGPAPLATGPWGLSSLDPLRMASLPLSPVEAVAPAEGEWSASVEVGYFNLWMGSWHTAVIHREFGLGGLPLEPWELRTLERRHPEDAIFRLDVEGWAARLAVARGLPGGMALSLEVPWVQIGAPRWDAVPYRFHELFGLRIGDRRDIARGQTLVYVRGRDRTEAVEGWEELRRSGPGDARITVSGPLGTWLGGTHRWAVSVEAPTGEAGTLHGSGGWDVGLRWFGTWRWSRGALRLAAGYARLDRSGSFLGVRRSSTWSAAADYVRTGGRLRGLVAGMAAATSPLAAFTDSDPGDPAMELRLGVRVPLGAHRWLEVGLTENVTGVGASPDVALQARLTVTLPGRS